MYNLGKTSQAGGASSGASSSSDVLAPPPPQSLQYSVRGLDDADVVLLSRSLAGLSAALQTINLSYNRITDGGATALSRVLGEAHVLTKLHLHENQIGA